jgi:structural maintenance of chromosome 1
MDDTHVLESTLRQRERCRERLERIERELSDVSGARSERLRTAIAKDQMLLSRLNQAITIAESSIDNKKNKLNELIKNSEIAKNKLNDLKQDIIEAEEDYALARAGSRQSNREAKYNEAIEQLQHFFPGVKGRLSELVDPTREKYKLATSIAMGKSMNSVIVDTKETAIACIQYLRSQRLGVAEFIPLESVHPTSLNENLRNLGKGYNLAYDCISFEEYLKPAVLFAVGNTVICDTFEYAKKLRYYNSSNSSSINDSRRNDYRVRAVTLSGQVIHKNMNITGGSTGLTKDRWNDKTLEKARKKRDTLERKYKKMEREYKMGIFDGASSSNHDTGNSETLREQMNILENSIKHEEQRLDFVKKDVPLVEKRIKDNITDSNVLEERLKVLKPEEMKENDILNEFNNTILTLKNKLRSIEDDMFGELASKLNTTVSHVREVHRNALSLRTEQTSISTKLKEKILILRSEYNLKNKRNPTIMLNQANEWLTSQKEQLINNRKEANALKKQVEIAQKNVEKVNASYSKIREQVALLRSNMNATGKIRENLSKLHHRKEKNINVLQQQLEQLRQNCHDIHQKARLDHVDLPLLRGKGSNENKNKKKRKSTSISSSSKKKKKKGSKRSRNSSSQSQPTGTDLSSSDDSDEEEEGHSEEDSEEDEDSEEEEDSEIGGSNLSEGGTGSSVSSMNSIDSSQYSGAFASSQAAHVRKDNADSENVDFSELNKDIVREWKTYQSNSSSRSRRGSRSSSSSSSSTGGGVSSRLQTDLLNFVEKTNTDLNTKVNKLKSELEEMQPNSRANEHLESTKERLAAASNELKDAKDASRIAARAFNEIKKKRLDTFVSLIQMIIMNYITFL